MGQRIVERHAQQCLRVEPGQAQDTVDQNGMGNQLTLANDGSNSV